MNDHRCEVIVRVRQLPHPVEVEEILKGLIIT